MLCFWLFPAISRIYCLVIGCAAIEKVAVLVANYIVLSMYNVNICFFRVNNFVFVLGYMADYFRHDVYRNHISDTNSHVLYELNNESPNGRQLCLKPLAVMFNFQTALKRLWQSNYLSQTKSNIA
jgi:hypothetical protein